MTQPRSLRLLVLLLACSEERAADTGDQGLPMDTPREELAGRLEADGVVDVIVRLETEDSAKFQPRLGSRCGTRFSRTDEVHVRISDSAALDDLFQDERALAIWAADRDLLHQPCGAIAASAGIAPRHAPRLGEGGRLVFTEDVVAPSGSVAFAGGAEVTRLRTINLNLAAADNTAVTEMCISNSTTCTSWRSFAESYRWSLGGTPGMHTVRVWYRDAAGNVSDPAVGSVLYDPIDPVDGALSVAGTDGALTASWSGFTDAHSGISTYQLRYQAGTRAPGCAGGTEAYTGSGDSVAMTGLTNGTTYSFRLCAVDEAGNVSPGATATGRPAPEYTPPTDGEIVINGGAAWTNRTRLTITPTANDDAGVSSVCLSTSPTSCTRWLAMGESVRTTVRRVEGTATVYAWFRDAYGNPTVLPVSDSIGVDVTRPLDGTGAVTIETSAGTAEIAWPEGSDARSGVAGYNIYQVTGTRAPRSCRGTPVWTGTEPSATITGLTDGRTYSWRICAVDQAGNLSLGLTTSGRPAPEYDAPVGNEVVINEGIGFTRSTRVTVAATGEDPSGLGSMCISNTDSCSLWVPYSESRTWNITGANGEKVVKVWLRDIYGNAMTEPIEGSIVLDTVAPTGGEASAEATSGTTALVSWTGFEDAASEVVSYRVVWAQGTTAPRNCSTGTLGYTGSEESGTIRGLRADTTHAIRVCALDVAGNVSTGVTTTVLTASEGDAPEVSTFIIDDGNDFTASTDFNLSVEAADEAGVEEMCFSTDANPLACEDWVSYDTSALFGYTGEEGEVTVYGFFRDGIGNVSDTGASDSIIYDISPPTDGEIVAEQSSDVDLVVSWDYFEDLASDIATYTLAVNIDASPPEDCSSGDIVVEDAEIFHELLGLPAGATIGLRVCAQDGAGNWSAGATLEHFMVDATAPVDAWVSIDGDAAATGNLEVSLEIGATDDSPLAEVCIANNEDSCVDWMPFESPMAWTLAEEEGNASVSVWLRDVQGNETTLAAVDEILLDLSPPLDGSMSHSVGADYISFSWADFSDDLTDVDHYIMVYEEGGEIPASCADGMEATTTTDTSFDLTGLTPGDYYGVRLCAVDSVGNVSDGLTEVVRPVPEFDAPEGTVEINAGALWTNSSDVSLTLDAGDESGLARYCVGTSPDSCEDWQAWSTSATLTLEAGEGTQTAYAWFEDIYGNQSAIPVSDTIDVDLTTPMDGSLEATVVDDNTVDLAWADFDDLESGIASYVVAWARQAGPLASCSDGEVLYAGTDLSFQATDLQGGSAHSFLVCGVDTAGNVSGGVAALVTTPDTTPPEGVGVYINGDAYATRSRATTLSLSAGDDTGVAEVCISNTTTCTTWTAFTATRSWTLASGSGIKTVYVKYRDALGNTSAVVSDSILVDTVKPVNGTVTATATSAGVNTLTWTGFTDASSGIDYYKVVFTTTATGPGSCTAGTLAYQGALSEFVHTGLTAGRTYRYRVCAIDRATNMSTGIAKTVVAL